MGVSFSVAFDDLAAQAGLQHLDRQAQEMFPLMDGIGVVLVDGAVSRIVSSNVAPDGTPWAPSQRAIDDGGRTLRETGRLADSITHEASNTLTEVGTNLIYAGIHQDGGEIRPTSAGALQFQLPNGQFVTVGKVTIPARPYLGISDDEADDIRGLIQVHFDLEEAA